MTGPLIHNSVDDLGTLALLFDQCHRPAHAENQAVSDTAYAKSLAIIYSGKKRFHIGRQ